MGAHHTLDMHFHRLGERCHCGYVGIPAAFYWVNGKEITHEKGQGDYLEWARVQMPELYSRLMVIPASPFSSKSGAFEVVDVKKTS